MCVCVCVERASRCRCGRKSFVDEILKRGTAQEKPRATTWTNVQQFFDGTAIEVSSFEFIQDQSKALDFHPYT